LIFYWKIIKATRILFNAKNHIFCKITYFYYYIFEAEEIWKVVWECGCLKTYGPDDLNFKFMKAFWKDFK